MTAATLRRIEAAEHRAARLTPDQDAEGHRAELDRCAGDVVYWLNTYGFTFDPRETPSTLPFILFPKQAEFLRWIGEREAAQEDGIAEKSRDVGFTWLCAAYAVHAWRFRPGFTAGFGSRKLELVDRIGDPFCIFEKIRFLLRHLPEWMLPAGFSWRNHDNYCKLLNPENGSTIIGEGGDEIGRGGRAAIYVIDEAAYLVHPNSVEASLSQTARVRIWVSTPNGVGNPFYQKRFSGKFPVFTFHWRDDPRKDDAWYAEQARKLDPVTLAQEVDIDYTASIEGICIPAAWVRACVNLSLTWPDGEAYTLGGPVIAGFDVADGGSAENVVAIRRGPKVLEIRAWRGEVEEATWRAVRIAEEAGAGWLVYDAQGPGASVAGILAQGERPLRARVVGCNGGAPASEDRWPDGRKACEIYANARAEQWHGRVRERIRKTWEHAVNGVDYPPDELLSIPDHADLVSDLSLPRVGSTSAGKTLLEAKAAMRLRGVASPDHGDALALTFATLPNLLIPEWDPDLYVVESINRKETR